MVKNRNDELRKTITHALVSILVGACVSFLTVIMQGLIDLLRQIPAELPGAGAAMAVYIRAVAAGKIG